MATSDVQSHIYGKWILKSSHCHSKSNCLQNSLLQYNNWELKDAAGNTGPVFFSNMAPVQPHQQSVHRWALVFGQINRSMDLTTGYLIMQPSIEQTDG